MYKTFATVIVVIFLTSLKLGQFTRKTKTKCVRFFFFYKLSTEKVKDVLMKYLNEACIYFIFTL